MKTLITIALFITLGFTVSAQTKDSTKVKSKKNAEYTVVEASCGQCQFEIKGKGCDLAVRFGDKAYYVDGTKLNDHGDAHAKNGFCNAIRKAKVKGEVVKSRFQVSYFELLPE